jgi:hypothetical protein
MTGMTNFRFTGSPKVKSAYAGGASRPDNKQNPNSDVTNKGTLNDFILDLPFCPKAIDSTGISLTGLSAEKTS